MYLQAGLRCTIAATPYTKAQVCHQPLAKMCHAIGATLVEAIYEAARQYFRIVHNP